MGGQRLILMDQGGQLGGFGVWVIHHGQHLGGHFRQQGDFHGAGLNPLAQQGFQTIAG